MLRDLLWGHFTELVQSGVLDGRTAEQRRRLFAGMQISLPLLLPAATDAGRVLPFDFVRRRRALDGDPCVCGSGLPYVVCCGRIPHQRRDRNWFIMRHILPTAGASGSL